jgi:uncharacterized membrane-anchored protein YhcB (DUF1043 family)
MGTMGWLALVAVGLALGFGIGRLWPSRKTKLAELEQERDQAHKELGTYREEVSAHFERTAELFDKVTADYRSLYEHLALSARQLGAIQGEPAERSLTEPEQRRLGPAATPHSPLDARPNDAAPDTEAETETDAAAESDAENGTDAAPETGAETEAKDEAGTAPASPRRGDS